MCAAARWCQGLRLVRAGGHQSGAVCHRVHRWAPGRSGFAVMAVCVGSHRMPSWPRGLQACRQRQVRRAKLASVAQGALLWQQWRARVLPPGAPQHARAARKRVLAAGRGSKEVRAWGLRGMACARRRGAGGGGVRAAQGPLHARGPAPLLLHEHRQRRGHRRVSQGTGSSLVPPSTQAAGVQGAAKRIKWIVTRTAVRSRIMSDE